MLWLCLQHRFLITAKLNVSSKLQFSQQNISTSIVHLLTNSLPAHNTTHNICRPTQACFVWLWTPTGCYPSTHQRWLTCTGEKERLRCLLTYSLSRTMLTGTCSKVYWLLDVFHGGHGIMNTSSMGVLGLYSGVEVDMHSKVVIWWRRV